MIAPAAGGIVDGELYTLDPARYAETLAGCDELEELVPGTLCGPEYERREVEVLTDERSGHRLGLRASAVLTPRAGPMGCSSAGSSATMGRTRPRFTASSPSQWGHACRIVLHSRTRLGSRKASR
jgi:hypothetical protein